MSAVTSYMFSDKQCGTCMMHELQDGALQVASGLVAMWQA